jgi:hypothetical protein
VLLFKLLKLCSKRETHSSLTSCHLVSRMSMAVKPQTVANLASKFDSLTKNKERNSDLFRSHHGADIFCCRSKERQHLSSSRHGFLGLYIYQTCIWFNVHIIASYSIYIHIFSGGNIYLSYGCKIYCIILNKSIHKKYYPVIVKLVTLKVQSHQILDSILVFGKLNQYFL